MKKRFSGTSWQPALLVGLLAAGLMAPAIPLAAQEARTEARQECRCVDRDGNEIENCTCIRTPRIEVIRASGMGAFFQRRAQIGVWLQAEKGDEGDLQGGVSITRVQEDGPAADAGLQSGDLIVSVAGRALDQPLADADEEEALDPDGSLPAQRFMRIVGGLEPGEPVEFQLLREGRRRTVTVTPEAAEGLFGVRMGEAPFMTFDEDALRLDLRQLQEEAERVRAEMEQLRAPGARVEAERLRAEMEQFQAPRARVEAERLRAEMEQFRAPGTRVWTFRAPEGGAVMGFRGDSLTGQSAFSFFGGDPCFTLERGEGRAFAILAGGGNCVDGVEFVELNPDLAEYFEAADGGVLVTEVSPESTLGLRAGDVLVAVDGREVRDPGHVRRILSSYQGDEEVRLRILRKGQEMEVLGRRRDG